MYIRMVNKNIDKRKKTKSLSAPTKREGTQLIEISTLLSTTARVTGETETFHMKLSFYTRESILPSLEKFPSSHYYHLSERV